MSQTFPTHHLHLAPSRPFRPAGIDIPLELLGRSGSHLGLKVIKHDGLVSKVSKENLVQFPRGRKGGCGEIAKPSGLNTLGGRQRTLTEPANVVLPTLQNIIKTPFSTITTSLSALNLPIPHLRAPTAHALNPTARPRRHSITGSMIPDRATLDALKRSLKSVAVIGPPNFRSEPLLGGRNGASLKKIKRKPVPRMSFRGDEDEKQVDTMLSSPIQLKSLKEKRLKDRLLPIDTTLANSMAMHSQTVIAGSLFRGMKTPELEVDLDPLTGAGGLSLMTPRVRAVDTTEDDRGGKVEQDEKVAKFRHPLWGKIFRKDEPTKTKHSRDNPSLPTPTLDLWSLPSTPSPSALSMHRMSWIPVIEPKEKANGMRMSTGLYRVNLIDGEMEGGEEILKVGENGSDERVHSWRPVLPPLDLGEHVTRSTSTSSEETFRGRGYGELSVVRDREVEVMESASPDTRERGGKSRSGYWDLSIDFGTATDVFGNWLSGTTLALGVPLEETEIHGGGGGGRGVAGVVRKVSQAARRLSRGLLPRTPTPLRPGTPYDPDTSPAAQHFLTLQKLAGTWDRVVDTLEQQTSRSFDKDGPGGQGGHYLLRRENSGLSIAPHLERDLAALGLQRAASGQAREGHQSASRSDSVASEKGYAQDIAKWSAFGVRSSESEATSMRLSEIEGITTFEGNHPLFPPLPTISQYSPPFQFHFPSPPASDRHFSQNSQFNTLETELDYFRGGLSSMPTFNVIHEQTEPNTSLDSSGSLETTPRETSCRPISPETLSQRISSRNTSKTSTDLSFKPRRGRNTFGMLPHRQLEPFEDAQTVEASRCRSSTSRSSGGTIYPYDRGHIFAGRRTDGPLDPPPAIFSPSDPDFTLTHISLIPLPPSFRGESPWRTPQSSLRAPRLPRTRSFATSSIRTTETATATDVEERIAAAGLGFTYEDMMTGSTTEFLGLQRVKERGGGRGRDRQRVGGNGGVLTRRWTCGCC